MKHEFKKGDKVKWFQEEYSVAPIRGTIESIDNKNMYATVFIVERVPVYKLQLD